MNIWCYKSMFENCSKLCIKDDNNEIIGRTDEWQVPNANIRGANEWNQDMFKGCENVDLNTKLEEGKSKYEPSMNTTYYQKHVHDWTYRVDDKKIVAEYTCESLDGLKLTIDDNQIFTYENSCMT